MDYIGTRQPNYCRCPDPLSGQSSMTLAVNKSLNVLSYREDTGER